MSYQNIKADCNQSHKHLEATIAFLHRYIEIFREDDDEWHVSIPGSDAEKIVELLKGVSGILHHLGSERDAAGALLRQHQPSYAQSRDEG